MVEGSEPGKIDRKFFTVLKNTIGAPEAVKKIGKVRINKTNMMQHVEDAMMSKFTTGQKKDSQRTFAGGAQT